MQDHIIDWLSLLGRWAHIITGIAWIGSSFFFMWLDSGLTPPEKKEEGVEGELFLVHSGGYYRIHKKLFGHGSMPAVLHWFKWEAAFSVITGYFLLGVIYYSVVVLLWSIAKLQIFLVSRPLVSGLELLSSLGLFMIISGAGLENTDFFPFC